MYRQKEAKLTHQNYRKNLSPRHNDPGAQQAAISNREDEACCVPVGSRTPADPNCTDNSPLAWGAEQEGRREKEANLNRAGHGPRRRGCRARRRPHGSTASESRRRRRGDGRLPEPSGDPHALCKRKVFSASPSQRSGEPPRAAPLLVALLRFPSPTTRLRVHRPRRARAHLQRASVERAWKLTSRAGPVSGWSIWPVKSVKRIRNLAGRVLLGGLVHLQN